MIINSSAVAMSSNRSYSSYSRSESASVITGPGSDVPAALTLTKEGLSKFERMKEFAYELNNRQREEQNQNHLGEMMKNPHGTEAIDKQQEAKAKTNDELKLEILRKLLQSLQKGKFHGVFKGSSSTESAKELQSQSVLSLSTGGNANAAGRGVWQRTTVVSSFFSEHEHTAFETTGVVKTADGREIDFNISLEMSRAFCEQNETLVQEDIILTDPLVINVDAMSAAVSDQKFLFDIDADGKEDEISFLGQGSGFLALDQNEDGKINDGSELFGTKSGDGFADLAKYDQDGNGWIDEADQVFQDLKIWMKNDDGTDRLVSLKEAGVGALYLGSAQTQFSLNNQASNQTNAVIQKTGVYLKESGEVGTLQHVDFAV